MIPAHALKKAALPLTPYEWNRMAELLERAEFEYPQLIGFAICKDSARILGVLKTAECLKTVDTETVYA